MANKYKEYARKVLATEGEVVLTYGVKFINNPEIKPHRHNQERPFLIVHVEETGAALALKMTSKIGGYMSEFKINPKHYEATSVLSKTSVADTRYIYEVDQTDITQNGFKLTEKEMDNLFSKIVNIYCLNESQIKKEQIRIIFDKYMKTREIIPGSVIKVPYNNQYLFVIEVTDKGYNCVPLYKSGTENTHGKVKIFKEESYIDFDEEYTVSKEDVCYILKFSTDEENMNYIIGRVKSRRRYHENKDNCKKNLISTQK